MTDKLYFGATATCRASEQSNTFMQTQSLKDSNALLPFGIAAEMHRRFRTFVSRASMLGIILLAAIVMNSNAQVSQWVAYNDYLGGNNTSNRTTVYNGLGAPNSGFLTNIATGARLGVTLTVTNLGCINGGTSGSPAAGSPAGTNFIGYVTFANGIVQVQSPQSASNVLAYVFTGLDPSRRYNFRGTAVRGNGAYSYRWTMTRLVGAVSFSNAHSTNVLTSTTTPGVGILATNEVAFNGGIQNNAATGDIVDWENIVPGANGTIVIYNYMYTNQIPAYWNVPGNYATNNQHSYGFEAIRLEEIIPPGPPVITSQPVGGTVSPGTPFTFTVTAAGTGPFTYQWRKNTNIVIGGATSSNYTILSPSQTDSGYYSVLVSNAFGFATSTDAFLSVQCTTPAGIATQPANQSLSSGGTINVSVTASGTGPISYQWYRNGTALPNATNAAYTKVNAQPGDSGLYSVVVNNCFDSPFSSSSAVISVSDPSFVLMGLTNYIWRYEESDTDLGTAWRNVGFNDSAWNTGRGILAIESSAIAANIAALTNTVLTLQAGGTDIPTHYFRTTFVLTNDLSLVSLVSSNYFDDGCVVYLNGTEAFRVNMGAVGSAVTFNTLASATDPPGGEGTFYTTNLPSSLLVQGTNTVAVEVHQVNLGSSDADWGMEIRVQPFAPTLLVITNQPQNLSVEEAHQVSFTLGVQGQPAYFQWYKNGVAISNGTSNPFIIPVASTNDAGNYFAVASNSINSVTSSVVALSIFTDTNGPTLVDADGTLSNNAVLVTYSELVLPSTATNIANYKITNTLGGTLTISKATLVNGSNVLLITSAPRLAGSNYLVIVNSVKDVSPRQNLIAANSLIPVRSFLSILAFNAAGKFYDPFPPFDQPDLGTAWRNFTYDTSNWGDGSGVYFNGFDSSVVPGPVNTQLSQTPTITSYFRNSFNLQASPGGLHLLLTHIVDDGAVFYLNGSEIYRFNMPTGTVDYLTPSASTISDALLARIGPIDLPVTALQSGANVLATELHQTTSNDVDKIFGAQLDASVQSFTVGPVVITSGPSDVTVPEGQSATFSIVQVGGATFQWQTNNVNVAGATSSTYGVTNVTSAMNGRQFRIVVTGSSGSATSTNATLHVIADTNAPTLVSAYASANAITVSFSEPVTSVSAQNTANYTVTNGSGQSFSVTGAVLANGTNATLSFASLPFNTYYVVVSNVKDTSTTGNTIAPGSSIKVGFQFNLGFTGAWKFDSSNVDLGTNWIGLAYSDASWFQSNGLFAAKNGTIPTLPAPVNTILTRTNNGTDIKTYYFRTHFNCYGSGAGTVTFRTIVDDGCVVYLNGVEIYRLGMPEGTILNSTLANRTVNVPPNDSAGIEGPFTVAVNNLVAGDNVIAVEVHEASAGSSDMYWAGEFSVQINSGALASGNPVQIVTQPRSRTNAVGSAASLYVVANGDPTLKYQWKKGGANVAGQTNFQIILNPIQLADAGDYTVAVSNSFSGALSSTATVTVTNTGGCNPSPITPASPSLTNRISGTNFILSWASGPVATNTCGNTGVFTLQGALFLSNSPSTILWSNITTISPYTNSIPTNRVPVAGGMRVFRLRIN